MNHFLSIVASDNTDTKMNYNDFERFCFLIMELPLITGLPFYQNQSYTLLVEGPFEVNC